MDLPTSIRADADYLVGVHRGQQVLVPVTTGASSGGPQNGTRTVVTHDTAAGRLVGAANGTLADVDNAGTAQVPNYELRASVIPQTGTLAALTALTTGGGELCSATDTPAIVQLIGTPGSGTYKTYTPLTPGLITESAGSTLTVKANDFNNINGGWGTLSLQGGNNSAPSGSGGAVYIVTGQGATVGGGITLTASNSVDGQSGGNIAINADSGDVQGGSVTLSAGYGAAPGYLNMVLGNDPAVFKVNSENAGDMFQITGDNKMGMYGATPIAKPVVSGSRGGNAALASLLTALANLGLITNSTTA